MQVEYYFFFNHYQKNNINYSRVFKLSTYMVPINYFKNSVANNNNNTII